MMLSSQVFAQAALLAGQLDERQTELLRVLCRASCSSLASRLRDGITPEDCKTDFVAAASLFALAALKEAGHTSNLEEFKAGDLTVRRSAADTPSKSLHHQAERIIMPFLKDGFVFQGV